MNMKRRKKNLRTKIFFSKVFNYNKNNFKILAKTFIQELNFQKVKYKMPLIMGVNIYIKI